jgi:AraC-like DNA-binding protein
MRCGQEDYFRYIPVRQRDIQWGLSVIGAGFASIPPGAAYPPPGHPELYEFRWHQGRSLPEYQVLYLARGEGIFESSGTARQPISAGTVLVVFPGVWHRYRPEPSTGWDEYWVSFNGEFMDRLVANGFFSPQRPVLATGPQPSILASYQAILDRLRHEPPGFPHLIAADTIGLLAAVSAATSNESQELIVQGPRDVKALQDRTVAEAMRLIWSQDHQPLTVESLARQLAITRRSLERRFQQALGYTVREEMLRCRLERVRRLLTQTDLAVREIVHASGFSSSDAMTRAFCQAEGLTPLKYRQKHRRA